MACPRSLGNRSRRLLSGLFCVVFFLFFFHVHNLCVNLRETIPAGSLQDASLQLGWRFGGFWAVGGGVLVQFFPSSCIGCIYLPSTPLRCLLWQSALTALLSSPPLSLPYIFTQPPPDTLTTALLSRGCRCTQFNFGVRRRRGRYVGIRDEHRSRGWRVGGW